MKPVSILLLSRSILRALTTHGRGCWKPINSSFKREWIRCSKIFQVDLGRQTKSPFIIFKGRRNHSDELVIQVQQYIESKFSTPLPVV
ncbi:hypothetical protein [Lunatimonas salinarum]|uniref:hypothetical protein n=1 Tax=Lunatimonas salinarum TaxID=1774590 RepID=UPI001ADFF2ED|nr:hypothetical protein [Lunatimonas salinarum]